MTLQLEEEAMTSRRLSAIAPALLTVSFLATVPAAAQNQNQSFVLDLPLVPAR